MNKAVYAVILILALILDALSIMAPAQVYGSDFSVTPSILLNEEYNDNVLLTTENKYDDYITAVAPSFSLMYHAPTWDWDLGYFYNYRYFAKGTFANDSNYALNLSNKNRIIRNILFLDVRDQYARVSLDLMRDYAQESYFMNQSEMNLLTINPYLVLKPLSLMTVTTGYSYMNTWYQNSLAIDRTDHVGYADIRQDLSSRSAVLTGVRHLLDITEFDEYTEQDVYLGLYHEHANNSTVTVKVGNSWFHFYDQSTNSQVFWDATFTQRYPTTTLTYETGLRFVPDPIRNIRREDRYLATIKKDIDRTSLSVSCGLKEYREWKQKHLENTNYWLSGLISYALRTRSKIIFELSAARLDDHKEGVSSDIYTSRVRLEYLAVTTLTLALDYRFTNVYSRDVYLDNYANNRFAVEIRKVF